MKADRTLWIDSKGRLCATPPSSGIKIAAVAGSQIPDDVAGRYNLSVKDGAVVQKGKDALEPKSSPDPLVADRDYWVTKAGELTVDEVAEGSGVKIASAGEEIPSYYVLEHGLKEWNGEIVQTKAIKKAENKAVESAENKGLTIESKKAGGKRTSGKKG